MSAFLSRYIVYFLIDTHICHKFLFRDFLYISQCEHLPSVDSVDPMYNWFHCPLFHSTSLINCYNKFFSFQVHTSARASHLRKMASTYKITKYIDVMPFVSLFHDQKRNHASKTPLHAHQIKIKIYLLYQNMKNMKDLKLVETRWAYT